MATPTPTPSAILNEKFRGKKLNISSLDIRLISNALSYMWLTTNKKIETCTFLTKDTGDTVKLTYRKGEGALFFDLHNENSSDFNFFPILFFIKVKLIFVFKSRILKIKR